MIDETTVDRLIEIMPNIESMTLLPKQSGEGTGTGVALPFVQRQPALRDGPLRSGAKMGQTLLRFDIYDHGQALLNAPPKPGDALQDAAGNRFRIGRVEVKLLQTVYKCTECRQEMFA